MGKKKKLVLFKKNNYLYLFKYLIIAAMNDPKDFSNIIKVDTHIHLAAAMTGFNYNIFKTN